MADKNDLSCSFCGKSATDVKKLIAGTNVYICNECVAKCHSILSPGGAAPQKALSGPEVASATAGFPTPREIKGHLDQYVIGQDYAKEVLSVAIYNHYKRIENPIIDGVEIQKSNILICGPTGSGKTLLVESAARLLDVPFTVADATSLTAAGYVGDDAESIVSRLLSAAENDVKRCERGIVFIDEIDKKRSNSGGAGPDVSGECVQQALLKLFEGSEVLVPPNGARKSQSGDMIRVNTKNILFIVGGAFVGLDKIIAKAVTKDKTGIGFGAMSKTGSTETADALLRKVAPEHLSSFGLIPELIGRLPIIAALSDLTEPQLVRILTEPKNALIKQVTAMFRLDGVQIEFCDDALLALAKQAAARKTGGRALRSVVETALLKLQFNLPEFRAEGVSKIILSASTITDGAEPEMIYHASAGAG